MAQLSLQPTTMPWSNATTATTRVSWQVFDWQAQTAAPPSPLIVLSLGQVLQAATWAADSKLLPPLQVLFVEAAGWAAGRMRFPLLQVWNVEATWAIDRKHRPLPHMLSVKVAVLGLWAFGSRTVKQLVFATRLVRAKAMGIMTTGICCPPPRASPPACYCAGGCFLVALVPPVLLAMASRLLSMGGTWLRGHRPAT